MAFDTPNGQELKSDINVTPLVDVMLVVLIIFMLVTPLLQKGVEVDLPRARNVLPVSEDESQVLVVVLKQSGDLFLESDRTDRGTLGRSLRARLRDNPGLRLQVKADRNIRYGDIKSVIQAGREAGFRGVSLIAEEFRDETTSKSRR